MKRVFDMAVAGVVLALVLPLLIIGMVGVKLSSPGPIFYRARRMGRDAVPFDMLKLRSMHVSDGGPLITARGDARIFRFGNFLRNAKIDELPQLLNVLKGDMSIVGPRPEDPQIVHDAYTDWMMETLAVRPGLTSPGAVFYYTSCERFIDVERPEESYIEQILPMKLAIERAYMERATLWSDIATMLNTVRAVVAAGLGIEMKPSWRDVEAARAWAELPKTL